MIKNVFGLAYGILLSYLVWIVFHYLTPLIMSFGWLGFIGILVAGSIAEMFLYGILLYAITPVLICCSWKVIRHMVCASLVLFGISSIVEVFNLDMEYTLVKWFLAIPYIAFICHLVISCCSGILAYSDKGND